MLDQNGKLVSAQPSNRVGRPGAGEEPLGRRDEQTVTLGVAQAVVHLLEVIQIQEEHRDRMSLPVSQSQGMAHPVSEECPVGQAGERIVGTPDG
jgi:hypothetical protein